MAARGIWAGKPYTGAFGHPAKAVFFLVPSWPEARGKLRVANVNAPSTLCEIFGTQHLSIAMRDKMGFIARNREDLGFTTFNGPAGGFGRHQKRCDAAKVFARVDACLRAWRQINSLDAKQTERLVLEAGGKQFAID